jgi:hypothetical protein
VVNILAVDFYQQVAKWAVEKQDSDAQKYTRWASQLKAAINKHLWNEKTGWFDNKYPDGSTASFWSYHLYDVLTTDVISNHQRLKLTEHLNEEEFLGELGMYSISLKDTVHWDLMDADFGGGGYYMGMPLRIVRALYEHGESQRGWDLLQRMARLADHFPYMPQSPRVDEPYEFWTGGNMQISAGGALEAVWYGIFGLRPSLDGSLSLTPVYHKELGTARLEDFRFRGRSYDIILKPNKYEVSRDGKSLGRFKYGKEVVIEK